MTPPNPIPCSQWSHWDQQCLQCPLSLKDLTVLSILAACSLSRKMLQEQDNRNNSFGQ